MKLLTIEQLKSLDIGDWVWVITEHYSRYVWIFNTEGECLHYQYSDIENRVLTLSYYDYGIKWLAYKNKEQAEGEANKEKPTKELSECYAYAQSACCTDDEQVYWLAGCIMTLTQVIAVMMGIELYDLNGSANEARLQEQRGEK